MPTIKPNIIPLTTPVLVLETTKGRYLVVSPFSIPDGIAFRPPSELPFVYRVSGPLELFLKATLPDGRLTKEEVLAWLDDVRRAGFTVEEGPALA